MKKILIAVLCIAMLISTMSVAVFADAVKTDRKIYLEVEPKATAEIDGNKFTEVYMNDEVTVFVKIEGEDLANALWELEYNPAHFELLTENVIDNNGTISGNSFKQTGVYAEGETLAEYKFKVIAQDEETQTAFNLNNTYAYTWMESWNPEDFAADSCDPANVLIKLVPYEVTVKVDDEVQAEDDNYIDFPYDNKTHSFEVITVPEATVNFEYEFNGEPVNQLEIKKEGTYKIKYTVDNATGFGEVNGEFTIVVKKPDYVVEVNLGNSENAGDYVANKKLVLVYTNTEGFGFTYNENPMIDVSANNYTYYDDPDADYKFTYAFVTEPTEEGTKASYETLVAHDYDLTCEKLEKDDYNTDINMDGISDIRDVTSAYGVHNVFNGYFTTDAKSQKKILKTDIDNSKCVEPEDATWVKDEIFK